MSLCSPEGEHGRTEEALSEVSGELIMDRVPECEGPGEIMWRITEDSRDESVVT